MDKNTRTIAQISSLFSKREELVAKLKHLSGEVEALDGGKLPPRTALAVEGHAEGREALRLVSKTEAYANQYGRAPDRDEPRWTLYELSDELARQARQLLLAQWTDELRSIQVTLHMEHGIRFE